MRGQLASATELIKHWMHISASAATRPYNQLLLAGWKKVRNTGRRSSMGGFTMDQVRSRATLHPGQSGISAHTVPT
jgi:hypothetical protein